MHIIFQLAFIAIAICAILLFTKKVKEIRRNILLGRDEDLTDHPDKRWHNVLLLAFGQKKMFKKPLVAVMHFLIYAGFIIINIEVLEIILDGIFGTHRLFRGLLGPVYSWLINSFEFLAVCVIVACVVFLSRRNILKLRRFIDHDLDGWPRSDANYILIMEIILMTLFLTMNASDTLLQSRGYDHYAEHITGNFAFSSFLASFVKWSQQSFFRSSGTWLLVVAHYRHFCIPQLPAFFKTSAYYHGISKCILCTT